jgi:hypothetical protein
VPFPKAIETVQANQALRAIADKAENWVEQVEAGLWERKDPLLREAIDSVKVWLASYHEREVKH